MILDSPPIRDAAREGPPSEVSRSSGPFDRVLLAVDAEIDREVIETAVSVAAAFDASIHALSVVPMRASVDHWDFAVERREAEAERALDRVGDAAGTVSVTKRLRYGDPVEEIELYAEHNAIDLVVAGESKKTGLRRFFSPKSVTDSLRQSVSVPVLAVPRSEASRETETETETETGTESSRGHPAPSAPRTAMSSDD
jgi:nucleotide-binding universal stress UspA family protein